MIGSYDGKVAGLYDLEETLGRGHYAVVKLARHVFTGERVAVKVIDKLRLDEISQSHLFQEVRCMKLVQHPNVVRLYEVIDTQTKLYLILEWADGGDMYDYIMKHEFGLSESAARQYFRQIVNAISFCHKLHVVHRDLKPENVVFFEKLGMVKLTDFGFSNKFCPGQKLATSCGSLAYSAPEILLGDAYDAPAVDIWSLGVILYMLVVGQAPFQELNDSETLTKIMDCQYTIPEHVTKPCKELISRMLIRDPLRRATLEEIATDPWLLIDAPPVHIADVLPLVSKQHLTEEDHAHIIHKMSQGSIATMEEILDALDRNEYNHVTATYFLLAERKLKSHRMDQLQLSRHSANDDENESNESKETKEAENLTPVATYGKIIESRIASRLRTFSILEEEEEDLYDLEELPDEKIGDAGDLEPRIGVLGDFPGELDIRGEELVPILDGSDHPDQRSRSESRSGSRPESRSGSRRGSRASSSSSLKDKTLKDMKLDLTLLHRLECSRRNSTSGPASLVGGSTATSPSVEEIFVPQPPFPPSSHIGLGRSVSRTKSGASSPTSTPPTSLIHVPNSIAPISIGQMSNNGPVSQIPSTTPVCSLVSTTTASTSTTTVSTQPLLPLPHKPTPQSSISSSPTSQKSSPSSPLPLPSSPKTQSSIFSPKFKTLPSPNRRLHSVRSSPQLILNEIFEEGESDAESGKLPKILEGKNEKITQESWIKDVRLLRENCGPQDVLLFQNKRHQTPSVSLSPSDLRRRRISRSRTLSGSSSDASEEDVRVARRRRKRLLSMHLSKDDSGIMLSGESRKKSVGSRRNSEYLRSSFIISRRNSAEVQSAARISRRNSADVRSLSGDRMRTSSGDRKRNSSADLRLSNSFSNSPRKTPDILFIKEMEGSSINGEETGDSPDIPHLTFSITSPTCKIPQIMTEEMISKQLQLPKTNSDLNSSGSTEILDVDTTLRESRSFNCIVRATNACNGAPVSLLDQTSSSLDESYVVGISGDNITTIYIDNNEPAQESRVVVRVDKNKDDETSLFLFDKGEATLFSPMNKNFSRKNNVSSNKCIDNYVALCEDIRDSNALFTLPLTPLSGDLSDNTSIDRLNSTYPSTQQYSESKSIASDSTCSVPCLSSKVSGRFRAINPVICGNSASKIRTPKMNSKWSFRIGSKSNTRNPIVSQPQNLGSSLSKSASHLETVKTGNLRSDKLKSSHTNGSIKTERYLVDINQNGGGRKSRLEKAGLALPRASKCCTVS